MADSLNLQESLRTTSERFLDAAANGPEALAAFARSWSELQRKITAGKESSTLDAETISLAQTAARGMTVLTQSFLDFEVASSSCHSRLLSQYHHVLDTDILPNPLSQDQLTPPRSPSPQSHRSPKPSLQPPRHPTTTPISSALAPILPSRNPSSTASITESSRSASDPNPLPEFIEHAYKYLVAHLFNPYPSRDEKQAIVAETNNARVTFTSVSNWFTNARRRCGWSAILKRRCGGDRDAMVDLATRVFVRPDPRRPVERAVVDEFVEMREAVESMYERKTRTSAWIEDLDSLDELINPITGEERLAAKKRETEEEREARRREKERLKEQREFERQKRKMQAEALRKAEKVAKQVHREQAKERKKDERTASFAVPLPPQTLDEEFVLESTPVAGGKRKLALEDSDFYGFPEPRNTLSASSSFSDISSDGRVPSLTWSDSGDERPYKRTRCEPYTPPASSPSLAPTLELPTSFDYSFTFEPPAGLTDPTAFNTLFDFSVRPSEMLAAPRGQKRQHDDNDATEVTPRAKRVRSGQPVVASPGPEITTTPRPLTPLFTPRPSIDYTATRSGRRRSIQVPVDLDAVLGLEPVQITPPDASVPLDVGVFDWSAPASAMDPFAQADFSQLLQLFSTEVPEQVTATPLGTAPRLVFDLADPPPVAGAGFDDFGGLISDELFNEAGLDFSGPVLDVPPTPSDVSRASSVAPATPTPAEFADKALNRERKRRELEEKRAALERERARLAELERELEDY